MKIKKSTRFFVFAFFALTTSMLSAMDKQGSTVSTIKNGLWNYTVGWFVKDEGETLEAELEESSTSKFDITTPKVSSQNSNWFVKGEEKTKTELEESSTSKFNITTPKVSSQNSNANEKPSLIGGIINAITGSKKEPVVPCCSGCEEVVVEGVDCKCAVLEKYYSQHFAHDTTFNLLTPLLLMAGCLNVCCDIDCADEHSDWSIDGLENIHGVLERANCCCCGLFGSDIKNLKRMIRLRKMSKKLEEIDLDNVPKLKKLIEQKSDSVELKIRL